MLWQYIYDNVYFDVALHLILNVYCRYSCYSISGHECLWHSCFLVIVPTEASSEEGRDEASISLALFCTYVWQVYESLALLDRKQSLCLHIPGLLRLLLTKILLDFHHFLCQNLKAPKCKFLHLHGILWKFILTLPASCAQTVFYKAVSWTRALYTAMCS